MAARRFRENGADRVISGEQRAGADAEPGVDVAVRHVGALLRRRAARIVALRCAVAHCCVVAFRWPQSRAGTRRFPERKVGDPLENGARWRSLAIRENR